MFLNSIKLWAKNICFCLYVIWFHLIVLNYIFQITSHYIWTKKIIILFQFNILVTLFKHTIYTHYLISKHWKFFTIFNQNDVWLQKKKTVLVQDLDLSDTFANMSNWLETKEHISTFWKSNLKIEYFNILGLTLKRFVRKSKIRKTFFFLLLICFSQIRFFPVEKNCKSFHLLTNKYCDNIL